jgi:uncharacterized membrane protein (GlpM family)
MIDVMDVEQSNRGPAAFRASCIAGILAVATTFAILFAAFVCIDDLEARLASASCFGAFVICKAVRILNRSDDRRPPDAI